MQTTGNITDINIDFNTHKPKITFIAKYATTRSNRTT